MVKMVIQNVMVHHNRYLLENKEEYRGPLKNKA